MSVNFNEVPKASEVIKAIQDLIDQYGDLPLLAKDADTGWELPIGIIYEDDPDELCYPPRFLITTEYGDGNEFEPFGKITTQ